MPHHKMFNTIKDVPIIKFATIPRSHPQLQLILLAYKLAGAGVAIKEGQ